MKVIQVIWKGLVLTSVVGVFFLIVVVAQATDDPRANRDTQSARDRVAAFCDPADYPRELRGETLDCSGFPPTSSPQQPAPTQGVDSTSQPTATPRVGEPDDSTATPDPSNGGSDDDDQCADDKSYTGDYCGWSPGIGEEGGASPRIGDPGGPVIKGLSYTSGSELEPSDIILLTGVLCLLLYIRSKIAGSTAKLPNRKKRLPTY